MRTIRCGVTALLLLCLLLTACQQHPDSSSPLSGARGAGSCGTLAATTTVVNIFVSDDESSWDEKAVDETLAMLDTALSFLRGEGSAFGKTVAFASTDAQNSLYLTYPGVLPVNGNDFAWQDTLFRDGINTYFRAQYANTSYAVLLHLNKAGRSYSLSCNPAYADSEAYRTERAVFYRGAKEETPYYLTSSVMAHELLHLFGAADLYAPCLSEGEASSFAALIPNDIMQVIPDDLGEAALSPLTAWLTGLTEVLPPEYSVYLN